MPWSEEREDGAYHITEGTCTRCGARKQFESNSDEIDRQARKMWATKGSKKARRPPPPNEVVLNWND